MKKAKQLLEDKMASSKEGKVYLDKQISMVYDFEHDNMEEYPFDKEIPLGIYEGFLLKIE